MTDKIGISELANIVNGTVMGDFDDGMTVIGTCAIDNYVENKKKN